MPIYVLECCACGRVFDRLFARALPPGADPEGVACPDGCGSDVKRKPTVAGVKLVGDGWASDGYKGKPEKESSE
jgi:predicted nucleic acid-binding Zn ribbon protein